MRHKLYIAGFFGIYMAAIGINQNNDAVIVIEEITDQNEQEIIVEGNASYGNKPITGKACIVMNSKQLKKKKVGKGDIVIAPAIHSNWYPELMSASAIIIEKGDETSHAIALGKKLDIPVIVGARDATKKILDGQTITCDPITRNVYHVAYPNPKETYFDTIVMPSKIEDHRSLYEKITNTGNAYSSSSSSSSKPSTQSHDGILEPGTIKNSPVMIIESDKSLKKIKNLFNAQFGAFKSWISTTKKELSIGRHSPRWVLKLAGCDDFAIDCIPLSFVFFDSNNIDQVLKSLNTDDNLQYIGSILEECKQKPGDVNWAGFVAHKKNASTIPMPENIDREKLMKDPKAYAAVQDRIDEEARKVRIAAGLFAHFCAKFKLFPQ